MCENFPEYEILLKYIVSYSLIAVRMLSNTTNMYAMYLDYTNHLLSWSKITAILFETFPSLILSIIVLISSNS